MEDIWINRRLKSLSMRQHDHRTPFQRDRARVLHSAAFRRLQSKTQVMGSGQSDFYRTRLTHSLEAAQIGSGIVAQLKSKYVDECHVLLPSEDALIETICLAHDIGHPPFGHGGEVALNFMMRQYGGFEGNGQTLRIVSKLEPFSEHNGMNLSRRTLLGLLKYPETITNLHSSDTIEPPITLRKLKAGDWHPPKGIYQDDTDVLDWILEPLTTNDKRHFTSTKQSSSHLKTRFKSLDCSIMELADDIAYGIHDLEDAIVTKIVSKPDFITHVSEKLKNLDDTWLQKYALNLAEKLFSDKHHLQKDAIGGLVNYLITSIKLVDLNKAADKNKQTNLKFEEPLLRYNAKLPLIAAEVLQIFKDFVFNFVIKQTSIQRIEYRGQQIVMELFEALASDPQRLLPSNTASRWDFALANGLNEYRVIADYVAGMTDEYANRLYQTLFIPSQGSYRDPNS